MASLELAPMAKGAFLSTTAACSAAFLAPAAVAQGDAEHKLEQARAVTVAARSHSEFCLRDLLLGARGVAIVPCGLRRLYEE